MVDDKAGSPLPLVLDSQRGKHGVEQVLCNPVGKHHPEPLVNHVRQLFADEVSVLPGGLVTSLADAFVLEFGGPQLGLHWHTDAVVSEVSEVE
jgi:hypothetical protein